MWRKDTSEQIKFALETINSGIDPLTVKYPFNWGDIFSITLLISYYDKENYPLSLKISNSNVKSFFSRMHVGKYASLGYIDNRNFHSSEGRFVEITDFKDDDEVEELTLKILSLLRKANISEVDYKSLAWIIPELMDNVILHANSPNGGFVCGMVYPHMNYLEFSIVDNGIGFKGSLQKRFKNIDDLEAMKIAVLKTDNEGTCDEKKGGGRGLPISWEIIKKADGDLLILSGNAMFRNGSIQSIWNSLKWDGVAIRFSLPLNNLQEQDLESLIGTLSDVIPPDWEYFIDSGISLEEDEFFS